MKFVQPIWLLIGVIACLALVWRYRRFDRTQTSMLASFVSPRLAESLTRTFSPGRRRLKRFLFVMAIACLFIALARPQAGFRWEETSRKGLEILFAVDTSKSMLAQDVKPDRLTRAKLAVEDLLGKLDGDGVGLVAFAGNSFLQCPVTLDYDAFRESIQALDTSIIPRGGSDIAAAIREAQSAFAEREKSDKILILITDGEDLGQEGITAAKAAAKDGVTIFTVGVGSAAGELIPVAGDTGGAEFVKDSSGQFVKSQLDEETLQQIAEATGGMYQPLGQQGQGLMAIYEQGLQPFTRHDLTARQHKVYLEQFHWPLLTAFVLFFIEPLIGTRRRTRAVNPEPAPVAGIVGLRAARPAVGALGLVVALIAFPGLTHASPGSAEKAYQKGDFATAVQDYAASAEKQPDNAQLQFNVGAAAYKAQEYASAQTAFESALQTEDLPVQQSAYYNLGNAQYRIGEKTEQSNPQQTIKTWESAVQSYEAALQLKPDDADAEYNRDLVKRKLEQLKQQQQQQQDQKEQQDQQDENKDQQQNQQSQSDQNSSDQNDSQDSKQNQQANNGSDQEQNQKPDQDQQNQQDQSASGQDQDENDQKNQSASGQGQPQQPEEQNSEQADASQGDKESKSQEQQQANAGEQPEPAKPSQGTPEANARPDQQPGQEQAQAAERREPGQMTREEAKRLLDSLKGEDQQVAAMPMSRGSNTNSNNQPFKDW